MSTGDLRELYPSGSLPASFAGHDLVTCARCGTEYDEASESVTWSHAYEEWNCTYMEECDNALFEQQQAGGHPDGF